MGFDSWFFARMDGADQTQRRDRGAEEWVWFPNNETLGSDIGILTHILDGYYYHPDGLGFDTGEDDTFFIDTKTAFYNAP